VLGVFCFFGKIADDKAFDEWIVVDDCEQCVEFLFGVVGSEFEEGRFDGLVCSNHRK